VVDSDAGNDCDTWSNDIGGIQPSAEPRFNHGNFDFLARECIECQRCCRFEESGFEFFHHADLLIFDAMYSLAEAVSVKEDWGHSSNIVAVELARRVFDTLKGATVLLVGAGEMAELAARHLNSYGAERILIANRTFERAEEFARELNGRAIPLSEFERNLSEADIVLCSTGAPHFLIRPDHVHQALNARRNRPMLLIDISVPRNIDPAISAFDNVFLFDIDDLENVIASNIQEREREALRAEAIIEGEAERFVASLAEGDLNQVIGAFRREVGLIVQMEFDRSRKRLGELSPEQEQAVHVLLNAVVNKLTLPVIKQLRESEDGHSVLLEAWRDFYHRDK